MLFREFEVVMWSCFSTSEKIKEIVTCGDQQLELIKNTITNHLVNTAYYCKQKVTSEEEFEAFRAFFNINFAFEGKHTEWLLMNEPDMSLINPSTINNRFDELKSILGQFHIESSANRPQRDYNKMVARLNEDAAREAHVNYLSKLKKKVE